MLRPRRWHSFCSLLRLSRTFQQQEGPTVDGRLTITEISKELGVTTKTIMRWEKAGKVKKAKRDWRGWRIYTHDDLQELKSLIEAVY